MHYVNSSVTASRAFHPTYQIGNKQLRLFTKNAYLIITYGISDVYSTLMVLLSCFTGSPVTAQIKIPYHQKSTIGNWSFLPSFADRRYVEKRTEMFGRMYLSPIYGLEDAGNKPA